jgi:hypothetical protein
LLNQHHRRDGLARTGDVSEKDAQDALLIGLAAHLLLVLTLLAWSWVHI